eukprot:s438_g16.t1
MGDDGNSSIKGPSLDRATTMNDEPETVASQSPSPHADQILEWVCDETWIDSEKFPCELDVMVLSTPFTVPILKESEKSLTVGEVLEPLFRDGLRPAKDGSEEFFRSMTSWLGGLSKVHAHDDLTLAAIQGYGDVLASATSIKERIGAANATLKAVQETAIKTNKKMVERFGSGPDECAYVKSRQSALSKWVTTRCKDLQTSLDTECSRHSALVQSFHDVLFHLMEKATKEYEDQLHAKLRGTEEDMFQELDAELGVALGASQSLDSGESHTVDQGVPSKPEEIDTQGLQSQASNETDDTDQGLKSKALGASDSDQGLPEKANEVENHTTTPESVPATMAFESMQKLLEEAISKSGASVDPQTKEALNKNLQIAFCDAFDTTKLASNSNSNDGGPPSERLVVAATNEFKRRDTSQLEEKSDSMKKAYHEELDSSRMELESVKTELETWYANRYEESQMVGAIKETFESLMSRADAQISSYSGIAKTIRGSVAL